MILLFVSTGGCKGYMLKKVWSLDFTGCNKYCEEWANRMSKPEVQNNSVKLNQIAEAYKLKVRGQIKMLF